MILVLSCKVRICYSMEINKTFVANMLFELCLNSQIGMKLPPTCAHAEELPSFESTSGKLL